MGSRLRRDVRHLYECYCEVGSPSSSSQDDSILIKYPVSYKDEELKTVPQFAFPCETQNTTVQHFSFVLTNLDSKWTFGFCRQAPNNQTAHVILSYLPWHELFYKILDHIAELLHDKDCSDVTSFLEALYNRDVPDPGTTLHINYGKRHHTFTSRCPNTYALPSIPENRNLTEYFNAVDSQNMMIIFASMLHERRIVMTSSRVSRLTASIQAANAVIYPMNWQHIFIPVLPVHLLDYLLAPMPFLIGVPRSTWERVRRSELGDAVILDVDTNRIETPFNDLDQLPPDIVSSMRRRLKTPAHMMNDGVARVFLRALVQLIGGYRDALRFRQGEQITFCRDAFLHSRPPMVRPFLESMLQLQIFQQFIEERLEMLNSGQGFSDEFELEACLYSDKSSNKLKQQYKEWLTTMNKKSGAIFKQVKSKANPAMRNAVKTVKEQSRLAKEKSRTAYKDFRLRFKDMQISKDIADSNPRVANGHELCSASSDSALDKPRSAPSSPKLTPVFGGGTKRGTHQMSEHSSSAHALRRCETSVSQHYHTGSSPAFAGHQQLNSSSSSSSDSECETSTEDDLRPAPLNMDLMEDLKNVIFRSSSFVNSATSPAPVPPAVDRSRKPSLCSPPVSPTRNEGSLSYPVVSGATPLVVERGLSSSSSSSVPLPLPPPRCRKRSSAVPPSYQQGLEEADLIHLGPSSLSVDEFDPLSSISSSGATVSESVKPVSNPLYPYHNPSRNGTGYTSRFDTREDPFSSLLAFTRSNFGPPVDSPDKSQAKPNWTTFE